MRVWGGAGDFPERRGLEVAAPAAFVCEASANPGDSCVVEPLVREVRTDVAGGAVAFPTEDLEAELLLGGECVAVAFYETVVGRVTGEDAADIGGEGVRDLSRSQTDAVRGLR